MEVPYVPGSAPNLPAVAGRDHPSLPSLMAPVRPADVIWIGDVQVAGPVINTPVGSFPLAGSQWIVVSTPAESQQTPAWAVVFAVLLIPFTCFLSFLLLLVKASYIEGYVQVAIHGHDWRYTAQVSVRSLEQIHETIGRINYVQRLSQWR
jgi:hypothetical protein